MAEFSHVPVMLHEVMEWLRPEEGGPYWDLTVGAGGHLGEWIRRSPDPQAYGLDGDPAALERAGHLDACLVHAHMGRLGQVVDREAWPRPRAVLLDLGLSSPQVDDSERGFSYRQDGPLDMRMNPTEGPTAAEWLQEVSQEELAQVLRELGEERFSGRIARVIKESLPINTTTQLAEAVLRAVGSRPRRHHPARRTFQAVRMAVNQELEKVQSALAVCFEQVVPGGRIAVISFHSGEDRVVKRAFKEVGQRREAPFRILTKKPLRCSEQEAEDNPRARSALLRVIERKHLE